VGLLIGEDGVRDEIRGVCLEQLRREGREGGRGW